MRKVIQIATMCHAGSDQTGPFYSTVALCDDGTVWEFHQNVWQYFPPIPQTPTPHAGGTEAEVGHG